MRLTQGLHRAKALFAERTSSIDGGRTRTWAETADRVSRLAAGLRAKGAQPGDRIAILSFNSDYYIEAYYAIAWTGCVCVPGNTRWVAAEHAAAFADSTPRLILADTKFLDLVIDLPGVHPDQIVQMDEVTPRAGIDNFADLIASHAPMPDACGADEELAGIFYTGGTTGTPKGVMLTHRGIGLNFLLSYAVSPYPDECVFLHSPPMFHLADAACIFGLTGFGATHVAIPSFQPGTLVDAILDHKVNSLTLVPTMIGMLVQYLEENPTDLSSVLKLKYGSSPISEALLKRTMEMLPNARISQAYGQTELSPAAAVLAHQDHEKGGALLRSAGRPLPTIDVRICDNELDTLPQGSVGEILVRSECAMKGYWNRPDLTATTLVDGWIRTGDAGYMDEGGYLYLVDRVKDMIVSGGENVFSAEVESALAHHPAVLECAIIGVPDPKWGERVHAVIRLKPGHSADQASLDAHCRSLIAGYKIPRSYDFWTEPLPLSGAGKILKGELRQPYWEKTGRAVG